VVGGPNSLYRALIQQNQ